MSKKIKNKNDDDVKYNSIVDEFNRNKRITKKLKFKIENSEQLWSAFLVAFKKTFHIKRELEINMTFNLKTGVVHSIYTLTLFDEKEKHLQLKWNNDEDKYVWNFFIKKSSFSNNFFIKTQIEVKKSTTFWGLQDTAGLIWWKRTFKSQMKKFKESVQLVIDNNDN